MRNLLPGEEAAPVAPQGASDVEEQASVMKIRLLSHFHVTLIAVSTGAVDFRGRGGAR